MREPWKSGARRAASKRQLAANRSAGRAGGASLRKEEPCASFRFSAYRCCCRLRGPAPRSPGHRVARRRRADERRRSRCRASRSCSRANGGERRVTTGPDGSYRATALAPGSYTLLVDAPGLALRDAASVSVGASETRHDLVLVPDAGPGARGRERDARRGHAVLARRVGRRARPRADRRAAAAASLLPLLQDLPGVATARTGQAGQQGSVFVRGGESRFARVLVDGVRREPAGRRLRLRQRRCPSSSSASSWCAAPSSSLYGTDALAGVVAARDAPGAAGRDAVAARRGRGRQRRLAALRRRDLRDERGVRLERGRAAAADRQRGAEQRLRRDVRGALRWARSSSERTNARVVARVDGSSVGTPGQTAFGRPDLDASFERDDLVVCGVLRRARRERLAPARASATRGPTSCR